MNRQLPTLGFVMAMAGALLASCSQPATTELIIEFETNGGSSVAPIKVEFGKTAEKPANPTKSGHEFVSWFVDTALKVEFDWSEAITADWTLYAKWKVVSPHDDSSEEPPVHTSEDSGGDIVISFRDASWWNKDAASTTYTMNPAADGKGDFANYKAEYDSSKGYDETNHWNFWKVVVKPTDTKIQFFRASGDGNTDWGARTVVIDLTARNGKTTWALTSTETWYNGGTLAAGEWIA